MRVAIIRVYKIVNMLSLDVVAGSVISALFFSMVFKADIVVAELIALALTVWIIYTADHLSDAKKIRHIASTDRHRFHQHHSKKLKSILVVALLMDGIAVLFIGPDIIRWGVILAFLVLIFLIIQQSIPWMKECLIAIFYTCGILLPSVTTRHLPLQTQHYLLIVQFLLVALTNLLLFSWFDRTTDSIDGLRSFVTVAGERTTKAIIVVLAFIQLAIMVLQLMLYHVNESAVLMGSMALILVIIFAVQRKYDDSTLSRFFAEAVFLLPIVLLL